MLVCSRHHTLIHQLGLHLVLHPHRRLQVSAPDGNVSAGTLAPDSFDRLDLGYVVSVLLQQAAWPLSRAPRQQARPCA